MRALRWLWVGFAVLAFVLLVGAWAVPAALDWNRYRGAIAAFASERLGRTVRIDGPVSLTLLPQPVLTAADVSVEGGGRDGALRADALRLRVALGPLLAGRIDARELVLRGLEATLPWPITGDTLRVRAPNWLAAVDARVEGGRLAVGALTVTGIDATLRTDPLTGSTAVAGSALFAGQRWRVTGRLTQPGGDGSAALDASLDGSGPVQGVGATLAAQLDADGALGGRVVIRGPDLSLLLPGPAAPFKAEGRLSIAGGLAAADDLAVEIGGSPARGAVALRLSPAPRLDVALAASRLDLDGWLPMLLGAGRPLMPTGIDLSAEAAQLAGGTIRRLRAAFDLQGDAVELRELRATLPGEAEFSTDGRIARDTSGSPAYVARFRLAAPSFRATLGWLEAARLVPADLLPAGVLRVLRLEGGLAVERGRVSLSSLNGTIDGSTASGSVVVRSGERFGVDATLSLDRVELDPWLAGLPVTPAAYGARLGGVDAALRLDAREARLGGVVIAPLSLDFVTAAGRLSVRRLEATADGVAVQLSGRLEEGRIVDGRLDVRTRRATPLLGWLPDAVTAPMRRVPALWRGPASLALAANGPAEALALTVASDIGDLRFEAQPVLDLRHGRWAGPVTLRHPGAPRLAEQLGLNGAPAWLGDGSLAVVAQTTAAPGRIAADSFDLSAGGLHATGQLAIETAGVPRVTGQVSATTLPLPLPYLRAPEPLALGALGGWRASVGVDAQHLALGGLPSIEQAHATVSLEGGLLRIDRFAGRLGGGALAGSAALDSRAEPPVLTVDGTLAGATVNGPVLETPVDLAGGLADVRLSLTASGHAPAALLATLGGTVRLAVRTGLVTGLDLPRLSSLLQPASSGTPARVPASDEAIAAALAGGATPIDVLKAEGTVTRGVLVLETGLLRAETATARISGQVDLAGGSVDLRVGLRPEIDLSPEIGLRLNGPVDHPSRFPELADLARWRIERAAAAQAAGSGDARTEPDPPPQVARPSPG